MSLGIRGKKILVVDNDPNVCQLLRTKLSILGFEILISDNGNDALTIFKTQQPDLLIIDIMIPTISGYTLCFEIRKESSVPIIVLTNLSSVLDQIIGFNLGIDDYLIKPFSLKRCEIKIKTILRRINAFNSKCLTKGKIVSVGNIEIDLPKRLVFKNNKNIRLTHTEFSLLELLVTKTGDTLSRTFILKNIWGYAPERYFDTRIVDVHVSRLRSKLEDNPVKPVLILTVRGKGYLLQEFQY